MAQVAKALRRGEILLIEDRNEVRQGLAQLLELHGFMVTEVADADHGMRELAANPQSFALVVLDLLLGDSMGGIDFRRRQLVEPHLAAVPTIVITATELGDEDRTASTRSSSSSNATCSRSRTTSPDRRTAASTSRPRHPARGCRGPDAYAMSCGCVPRHQREDVCCS